jgi:hypothetical protein
MARILTRFALIAAFAAFALAGVPGSAVAAADQPAGLFSEQEVAAIKKMSDVERMELLQKKARELDKLTRVQRQKYFGANREAFNALPPEKQKEIRERLKKASDDYIAKHKAEWEKNRAEEKKLADANAKKFLEQMPGIERAVLAKYKQLRKTQSKDNAWRTILDDARKGGKLKPIPE